MRNLISLLVYLSFKKSFFKKTVESNMQINVKVLECDIEKHVLTKIKKILKITCSNHFIHKEKYINLWCVYMRYYLKQLDIFI